MSMVWIFVSFLNYLVDTYLMYAASAIAANTVIRSAAGATAPLFTNQMYAKLGVGGGGSLVGGVATLLAVIPFAFYRYGERIRIKSKFAPTQQKKPPRNDEERQAEQQPREDREKVEEHQDEARHSSSSTVAGDTSEPDGHDHVTDKHIASSDGREKDRDVHQNSMGEPRTETALFGKEEQ
jgi:MFS transporter, DHA1 family, multidrug resistance protein